MRIFLDANILFSAAYSDSAVRRLVKDLCETSCSLVADPYVLEEALRNLEVHRPEAVVWLHDFSRSLTIVVTNRSSREIPPDIRLPDKDIPVLATALGAGCDILATGDSRHFGPLFGKTFGRLTILSPVDTARAVLGQR